MIKKIAFVLAAITLGFACQEVRAQSDDKKFEVVGQISTLSVPSFTATGATLNGDREQNIGFGGRFGYNISKHFALEVEGNFFTRDRDIEGGKKIQGLFGVKAGRRFDKVGVFAKARPGFVRFEKGDYVLVGGCPAVFPPPIGCFDPVAKTNLAIELGGVVEIYPSKNTLIRFDVGDTIIRFDRRNVAAQQVPRIFGSGLVVFTLPAETKHNFQASAGVGFRF